MPATKRPKRCSKPGCKAPVGVNRGNKCEAHYMEDYRAGVRMRQVDDLGPNPARLHAKIPRDLERRFHAAVPKDQRSQVLRRALETYLRQMEASKAASAEDAPADLASGD